MEELLKDLAALPSYDMECHGWNGDEMVEQKWANAAEYLKDHSALQGEWLRSEDVIELLKKHHLI